MNLYTTKIAFWRFTFLFSCYFCGTQLKAQQTQLFTQNSENQAFLNPAAIPNLFFTEGNKTYVGATFRKQWTDLSGGPTTQTLHGTYFDTDHNGVTLLVGGSILSDQTGPTGLTGFYGKIGGVLTSDPNENGISMALSAGWVQYRLNTADLKLHDKEDLAVNNLTQSTPDIGLGIFAYQRIGDYNDSKDYIYGGVSMPQLLGFSTNYPQVNGAFRVQRIGHYYANAGLIRHINGDSYIQPTVTARFVPNAPVNIDLNIRYNMGGAFYVGSGASISGTVHGEAGIILGKTTGLSNALHVGYSFDWAFQSYGIYAGSTHEFSLGFCF